MEYFGLEKELDHLGFFETDAQAHLEKELKKIIAQGRLIALSGIVGSGKTTFLQRLINDYFLQINLSRKRQFLQAEGLAFASHYN